MFKKKKERKKCLWLLKTGSEILWKKKVETTFDITTEVTDKETENLIKIRENGPFYTVLKEDGFE